MSNDKASPEPGWARNTGHARLKALDAQRSLGEGNERGLIAERIYRYGWAYDERDSSLLRDCFTEDGVWEGMIMGLTKVGPFAGREEITAFLTDFWNVQTDQRRHVFTNVIVDDLTATSAIAHAYLILTASTLSSMVPVTVGPYRFSMVKESDGVWRMQRLVGGFDAPF